MLLGSTALSVEIMTNFSTRCFMARSATIFVLIGGFKQWWMYGPIHRAIVADLVADRNFWRDMALRGVTLAERTADVALADLEAHSARPEHTHDA